MIPRQRQVIELRFGLNDGRNKSLAVIAREIGVSRSTVWATEQRALHNLRHPSIARLVDYIE